MSQWKQVHKHLPSIKFRYGLREGTVSTSSVAPSIAQNANLNLRSCALNLPFEEIPPQYARMKLSEKAIEIIELGGVQ